MLHPLKGLSVWKLPKEGQIGSITTKADRRGSKRAKRDESGSKRIKNTKENQGGRKSETLIIHDTFLFLVEQAAGTIVHAIDSFIQFLGASSLDC